MVEWTRGRTLHVVAPTGLLRSADLAALHMLSKRRDDLDDVAVALARLVGHPVRARTWEPPTSDLSSRSRPRRKPERDRAVFRSNRPVRDLEGFRTLAYSGRPI
jgi:hypothetical protein